MRIAQVVMIFVAATTLAGCSISRSIAARDAQSSLIGKTKAEILACAGIPHSAQREGGMEILAYHYGGDSHSFGTSQATATRTGPYSASGTGTSVSTTQTRQCTANFVFQNDRLVRLNYSGRTGGILTSGEQCVFIVQNCVN